MSSSMHHGFAMPVPLMLLVPVVTVALTPSVWIAVGVIAGFSALMGCVDALARWRAQRRIRRWAVTNGIHNVRPCPRRGFVSWGWSVWTFAEMRVYRGVDAGGSSVELLASYSAPAFGLIVRTRCEVRGTRDHTARPPAL